MRIKYEILWVEDEQRWFEISKKSIDNTLKEAGFLSEITRIESLKDLDSLIEEDGLQKYDLLLVDFMLGEKDYGNDIIQRVRTNNIYTDVVFYSSQLDSVLKAIQKNQLEGIYTSERTKVTSKFVDIFNKTIKKFQEVNTVRGLLMAETSDLDELMLEIIKISLSSKIKGAIEQKTIQIVKNSKIQSCKKITTSFDKQKCNLILGELKTVDEVICTPVFTSSHKAHIINEICNVHSNLKKNKFFSEYNNDVIRVRNIFGHVKEEDGKLVSTLTGEEETFDEERCTEIRKTLIEYRQKLESIKAKIS